MPATASPIPVEHVHELARVERLLRLDDRADDPTVQVGGSGARLSWDSWQLNEHARGSLTASVASEIATGEAWGLSTVHDPIEDGGTVTSMLTVVYAPGEAGDA